MDIQQALDSAMFAIGQDLRNAFGDAAPFKTGNLAGRIIAEVTSNGLMFYFVDYAKFVEFGTPPHTITPNTKKALAFKSGGDTIIVKKVNHPGTRPNPFIRTTLHTKLRGIVQKRLNEVLNNQN